ncbi:efflux RND transporter periplasmic adaptor subunit [Asaia sp. W19]|uniref:efflux RND transporter periplasmic adaptor subunit n=1 Tax=unclassified Asaia TaxID=2685023 RepID=UPI000F8C6BA7|nr:efflux RND transporter periplasmic adaptor subunit [Asaia sp. W19]RUT26368.1 efflux RND transporter periplasmic adaptor subunit [Asaia sp. W19]
MAMGSPSMRCAILALAFGAGFGFSSAPVRAAEPWRHDYVLSDEAQRNEHVTLVALRQGRVFAQVQAMARVDADTSRVIDIHSAGSGKVTAVHVTPGEPVIQGQALISYTDHSLHELQLQREQVEAALASARAGETEADLLYKRGLALAGSAVSRGELERRRMVLEQQRGLVTARKADLATLEHRQTEEFTSVTERIVQDEASDLISPVKGVVQAVRTSVAADISAGDNLVTVVDLSRLWLVADLSPEDASGLAPGGAAEFRLAGQKSGVVLAARISTIAGLADPATGLVRVVCVLDHPPVSLRPGMMLDAAFQTGEGTPGLVVPVGALQQINGEDVVFLRKDPTHFTPISVQIHVQDDDHAAISGALKGGQVVVEQGSFALKSMALLSSMTAD